MKNICDFPPDLIQKCLGFLPIEEIGACSTLSKFFEYQTGMHALVWSSILDSPSRYMSGVTAGTSIGANIPAKEILKQAIEAQARHRIDTFANSSALTDWAHPLYEFTTDEDPANRLLHSRRRNPRLELYPHIDIL